MSELKIEIPVVLKPDADKLKSEVANLKLKAEVELNTKDVRTVSNNIKKQLDTSLGQGVPLKINTTDLRSQFKILWNESKQIANALTKINTMPLKGNQAAKRSLYIKQLLDSMNQLQQGMVKLSKGTIPDNWDGILGGNKKAQANAQTLLKSLERGLNSFSASKATVEADKVVHSFGRVKTILQQLNTAEAEVKIDTTDITQKLAKAEAAVSSYQNAIKEAQEAQYRSGTGKLAFEDLDKVNRARLDMQKTQKDLNDAPKDGIRLQNENAKKLTQSITALKQYDQVTATIKQKLTRMEWLRENYSRAFKDASWAAEFERIFEGFTAGGSREEIQLLVKDLATLEMRARAAGMAGKTFGDRFRDAFSKFANWFSVSQIFMWMVEQGKKVIENVKAIDAAMTDLKKVSDAPQSAYDSYLKSAAKRSAEMGTRLTDYIGGTVGWSRVGEDLKDAQALGELSTIYYNVGDGVESVDDATASLISTMKAFKIEASGAGEVLDVLNHIGNNYNITSGGLGEAFQRSAASLAAANTDMNKSAALITAGNTILNNPEKVGNGLKTLSARLRGASSDLSELGEETDEYVVSTSKMQAKVEALTGVDIMKNATEFKDIYDILDEIAQVWDDLSDTTRADLAETLFGKNQSNLGIAILSNFETAREVLKDLTSGEATGSAMKEYDKYLGSVEAKTKKLSSNFERFSVGILDPDVLKVALDLINGLLEGVTNLVETLGSLPTVLGAISAAFSIFKPDSGIVKVQYAPPMKNSLAA